MRGALAEHFRVCDCHDSWDQCPCAEGGHPSDGSCDCCPLGTGLCGPRYEWGVRWDDGVTPPNAASGAPDA